MLRWTLLIALIVSCGSTFAADRPNILLVLMDDAGWTDVQCFGSRIQTPNIDKLASQGMRFTDCHSAAPNCSPSRAGLLTGRTPSRVGMYSYLPAGHVMHLRSEEITVAELLKDAGYKTGHFGKWHLSQLMSDQPQPKDQGFDYSLGTDNNAAPSHFNPNNFVRNGKPVGETKGYSCQLVVDEALGWLKQINPGDNKGLQDGKDPFFACVWFHEPHAPIASPPDLVEKYQKLYPELTKKQATYHANVDNLDNAVGRLMTQLDEMKLAENTFIFFTSDNGPLNTFSCVGLRGKKSNVWEGGHRVPGIFRWPGRINAGTQCDVPISGVDFLPTVCEIADIKPPSDRTIDGTSIWPLLSGDGKQSDFKRHSPLYWFFYRLTPSLAVRDGDWVLIANTNDAGRPKAHQLLKEDIAAIKSSRAVEFELFNLKDDTAQQRDLSDAEPGVLSRLKQKANEMHSGVVAEGHAWEIPESFGRGKKKKIWK